MLDWPLVHLRVASLIASATRRGAAELRRELNVETALVLCGIFVVMGLLVFALLQVPNHVFTVCGYVIFGLAAVVFGVRYANKRFWLQKDRQRYQRLLGGESQTIEPSQLLSLMAELRTGECVSEVLREVRAGRLLDGDEEAGLVVRDLLLVVDLGPGGLDSGEPDGARRWHSHAFAEWERNGGALSLDWGGTTREQLLDELGQLLEQLDYDEARQIT